MKGINQAGVYLLAHFRQCPSGPARPTSKQVIYIGETCDNTLRGRWAQFDRTVRGKSGHSGGWTYRQRFKASRPRNDLFVAAVPVDSLDEKTRSSFIRYAERKLIWDYARKWEKLPECNTK